MVILLGVHRLDCLYHTELPYQTALFIGGVSGITLQEYDSPSDIKCHEEAAFVRVPMARMPLESHSLQQPHCRRLILFVTLTDFLHRFVLPNRQEIFNSNTKKTVQIRTTRHCTLLS